MVVRDVEPELVEVVVDQAGDELASRMLWNQSSRLRGVMGIEPFGDGGRIVDVAAVVAQEKGHERILVELVARRVGQRQATGLQALDATIEPKALNEGAVGGQPLVVDLREIAHRAYLEREG